MRIIDIHAHVFPRMAGITNGVPIVSGDYGKALVGNEPRQILPPSFSDSSSTAEMLLAHMEDAGVGQALLMANPFYGYHNSYFQTQVLKYPDRFKGVALVDVLKGRAAADELDHIYDTTGLTGLKIEVNSTFQCAPEARLSDSRLAPVWELCHERKQAVFLHLFRDEDVADLKELVKRYPDISFVLCHLGADASFRSGRVHENFMELLGLVTAYKNVWSDISTVADYFPEEYPFPTAEQLIGQAWAKAGPEKLMWGSDYPGMLKFATYRQLLNLLLNGCKNIPVEHKEMILGRNAANFLFKEDE